MDSLLMKNVICEILIWDFFIDLVIELFKSLFDSFKIFDIISIA